MPFLKEYKGVWRMFFIFMGSILLCRITAGLGVFAIFLVAMYYMSKRRMGPVLMCYIALPLMMNTSSVLLGKGGFLSLGSRLGTVAMTILLMLQASSRRGNVSLPIGMLYAYLVIAVISSMQGYFPVISYLKILNFLIFILGIYFGTRNINKNPKELQVVRDGMLAIAVFFIFGSVVSYFIPALGYSMEVNNAISWGAHGSKADITQMVMDKSGILLFSGVTNHSQTLAPMAVSLAAWTLSDMIFCERRLSKLHLAILAVAPVLIFMTRSRAGFLGFVVAMAMICLYAMPKSRASSKVKSKMSGFLVFGVVAIAIALIIGEARNDMVSKWLRKTDDLSGDSREFSEAFMASRMGKVEANLSDFRKNPILGTGFQVIEEHQALYQLGRITLFSAPIEKGVLPLMVLGETGVVGAIVFAIFLCVFYGTCATKRYIVTASLFTVMLTLNMAEAGFFSPAGCGGILWIVLVVGGFVIDMYSKNRLQDVSWRI